jgi:hypothetical protein
VAASLLRVADPRALTIGLALDGLTALGLLGYAGFVLEQAATQSADSDAGAAVVVGSVLFWGVGVILATRGLRRRRRWARSPLVMTYLLLFAVGWDLVHATGLGVAFGVAVFALASTGLVVTMAPSVGAILR